MLVAWITNHRGNGFFIFRPGEGWEYVMTLTFVGFAIAVVGPGEWSLDDALDLNDDFIGATGLLIARDRRRRRRRWPCWPASGAPPPKET